MIAKYDGYCKVTHQRIVAGVTNIERIGGVWQVAQKSAQSSYTIPASASVIMAWSENDQDRWGDEIACHHVAFGDDDGEVIGKVWNCTTADGARQMAHEIFYGAAGKLADVVIDLYH